MAGRQPLTVDAMGATERSYDHHLKDHEEMVKLTQQILQTLASDKRSRDREKVVDSAEKLRARVDKCTDQVEAQQKGD